MHWYQRDPHAAIEGMLGLSMEERGAYNTLIDMLYARDGDVLNDDRMMAHAQQCSIRLWRSVRDRLIAKGKIRITADNKLITNGVENRLKTARKFSENQSNRAKNRWKSTNDPMRPRNAITSRKKESLLTSSFLGAAREAPPVDNSPPGSLAAALPTGALARPAPEKPIHELTAAE